jgi:hypothetical protein
MIVCDYKNNKEYFLKLNVFLKNKLLLRCLKSLLFATNKICYRVNNKKEAII